MVLENDAENALEILTNKTQNNFNIYSPFNCFFSINIVYSEK